MKSKNKSISHSLKEILISYSLLTLFQEELTFKKLDLLSIALHLELILYKKLLKSTYKLMYTELPELADIFKKESLLFFSEATNLLNTMKKTHKLSPYLKKTPKFLCKIKSTKFKKMITLNSKNKLPKLSDLIVKKALKKKILLSLIPKYDFFFFTFFLKKQIYFFLYILFFNIL
jgi:hypothetical protein